MKQLYGKDLSNLYLGYQIKLRDCEGSIMGEPRYVLGFIESNRFERDKLTERNKHVGEDIFITIDGQVRKMVKDDMLNPLETPKIDEACIEWKSIFLHPGRDFESGNEAIFDAYEKEMIIVIPCRFKLSRQFPHLNLYGVANLSRINEVVGDLENGGVFIERQRERNQYKYRKQLKKAWEKRKVLVIEEL